VQSEPEYQVDAAKIAAGQKAIALTIDDGPDPQWTPKVLEILRQHSVTATFFMIGSSAAENPDLVRAVAADGHSLATHTWSHKNLAKRSAAGVRTEIERGLDAVAQASGDQRPALFRAPYGAWSPTTFATCAALGQRPVAWSVDPEDWAEPGTQRIVNRVVSNTKAGSIILKHDGGGDRSQTVAALRIYVPQLLARGYTFVSL
jgi:peptidoglycan/xylan/chitin deacetylase (PgdA/CDA1 family)